MNNFAIDTQGIGEALTRSAASFNAANTDLSQAISLVTATNEVLQSPEAVGTLWKTLSARLRSSKTELEELGEEQDAYTESTSKLRDLVKSLTGFDILEKDEKTFKSIYDIILGIGKEWNNLTDIERASLGEALAGKRNSNGLYAVLGNLDTLQEAYAKAEASAGSAAKEQENYQKSLQYSLDRTKASLEELAYDLMDSDMLKGGIEFVNSLIQGVDILVEHLNPLTALLAGGGLLGTKGFISNFSQLSQLGEFTTLLNQFKGFDGSINTVAVSMLGLDKAQRQMLLSSTALTQVQKLQALESIGLTADEAALELKTYQLAMSQSVATASSGKLGSALKGVGTAAKSALSGLASFLTSPIGIFLSVIAGIALFEKALRQADEQGQKARDSVRDSVDNYNEEKNKLEELNSELQTTQERIDEINSKPTLTISDEEELTRLKAQNEELKEQIKLQEKIKKEANQDIIDTYRENEKKLGKDIRSDLFDYKALAQSVNDYESNRDNAIKSLGKENYETNLKGLQANLDEAKEEVEASINTYVDTREALLEKWGNDYTQMGDRDKRTFDDLSAQLREAYSTIYSPEEFSQYITESLFSDDTFSSIKEKMTTLIATNNGEKIDWKKSLGEEDWNSLRVAMQKYGVTLDDVTVSLEKNAAKQKEQADTVRTRLRELVKLSGKSVATFDRLTESMTTEDWIKAADHMDEFKQSLGLAKVTAEGIVPTFEEARDAVQGFISGTEDVPSELEDIQAALADTRNMSAETYNKLVSHSQKYANAISIENGRLVVNRARLLAIANSRVKEQRETLKQVSNYKKLEYLKRYRELKVYDNQLIDTTTDTYANVAALQDQITQLDLLSNQLDIASDSFERFKEAQQTENTPDYDTGMDAFNVIKEGLSSGKVGSDDFKYGMQALMSVDEYKKFVDLAKEGYDAQYDFMENWQKQNAKFFTEDDRANAIAWQKYLTDTGLLQDGMIASSEELGKATGLSYDAVNALNENLNQFSFGQDIITQSQIDYIDEAQEAVSNLVNARVALQEAEEAGADQNLITGLKEDVEKAQIDYDEFMASIPDKMAEAKQAMSEGKANTLSEALFGEDSASSLAFTETLGAHIDDLQHKVWDLETHQQAGTQNYKDAVAELTKYRDIQKEVIQDALDNRNKNIGDSVQNIRDSRERIARLKRGKKTAEESGNTTLANNLDQQIQAAQSALADLADSQVMIDIKLNKEALESEIEQVKGDIQSLQTQITNVPLEVGGGSYTAQMEMQKALSAKQGQLSSLEKQKTELEATIKYVTDSKDAEAKRNELSQDIDTNVNVDVKGMDQVNQLKSVLASLPKSLEISVTANVSGGGSLAAVTKQGGYIGNGAPSNVPMANGTAHAQGTNWSLSHNENNAIVGELGTEGLVRDGKFYLIGQKGPQRTNLKKGDIIFNHKQTEELLKNGYATERGSLIGSGLVDGTVIGSAFVNANNKMDPIVIRGGSSTAKSAAKATKEATDEIKEDIDETAEKAGEASENWFDWVERKIKNLSTYAERYFNQAQKAIDRVTNQWYSSQEKGVKAYKQFNSTINSLYKTASKTQKQLMGNEAMAYRAYMKQANLYGESLDPTIKGWIEEGGYHLDNIMDEALSNQIQKYQEFYDKSQEALDSFIEAAEKFYRIPLDKAATKVENLSNKIEYLDKVLSNAVGRTARNEVLDEQDRQQKKIYTIQKNSVKETEKNQKNAAKELKKQSKAELKEAKKDVKSKKTLATASKKAQKEIKKATKDNEKIDLKKLKKGSKAYNEAKAYNKALSKSNNTNTAISTNNVLNLENYKEGTKAYEAVVKYNAAVNAGTEAWNNMKNAEEEYIHWHEIEYPKAKFDNIVNDFTHAVGMLNHDFNDYQNRVNELQKQSLKVSTGYYKAQKKLNDGKMTEYIQERKELEAQISQIKIYSDEWYEAYDQIKEVDNAISELKINTMELNEIMRNMYFDSYQGMKDDIRDLISEQEFLQSLASHRPKTDNEIGDFTNYGRTALSSDVAMAVAYRSRQDITGATIKELEDNLQKGILTYKDTTFESAEQLREKIAELYSTWQSEIKDTYQAQSAVVDLMKEKYQAELAMYKDLVSSKKEALSAEKDLYEYQKKIAEKTKNIAQLEKQLAAYAGDTSQEGQARRQRLNSDLKSAREDLRETEYDRYISDQQKMLDDLIGVYEERIEKKLNDFDGLLREGIEHADANHESAIAELELIAGQEGYIPMSLKDINSSLTGENGATRAMHELFDGVFDGTENSLQGTLTSNTESVTSALSTLGTNLANTIINQNSVLTNAITNAIDKVNGKTAEETQNPPKIQPTTTTSNPTPNPGLVVPTGQQMTSAEKKAATSNGTVTQTLGSLSALSLTKDEVTKWIKANATTGHTPSNGKSWSAVEARVAKLTGTDGLKIKSGKNKGKPDWKKMKILGDTKRKELAELLGVTYDNASSSGNLYKRLKALKVSGFSKGGLVAGVNKIIAENGDDGIATVKVGEAILTPTDSKNLASLANKFEAIDVTADIMNMLKDGTKNGGSLGTPQNVDYGGVQFNFELPNVTDPNSFVTAIQRSTDLQKAIQSVSVDRINNGGRLSVNRIR